MPESQLQTRKKPSPIVGCGIDTLKVNIKLLDADGERLKEQVLPESFLMLLQHWQEQAKAKNRPEKTSMTFHHARLMMYPNGAQGWQFILRNDCLELKIVPRLKLSMVAKVVLSSYYLWNAGPIHDTVDELHGFLIDLFGPYLDLQAAQIDLCVDLIGLSFPLDWRKIFIAKAIGKRSVGEADKDRDVYRGQKLETIMLSGHGSPLSFKCYNKSVEIRQRSKDKIWFHDIWKRNGWDGETTVWRKEFSVERAGLHEMGLEDLYDTLRNIKRIWAYCTGDWLRMVVPERTKNRSRWRTHPTWTLLQQAFDDYGTKELDGLGDLARERKRQVNREQAVAAFAGYSTTFAAWCEAEIAEDADADEIFRVILGNVVDRWEKLHVCTEEVIRYKKFLYSQKP